MSIDTGVDGVGGVWPVSDRCLRVVGQGDACVVSERVGVSSVGVSSVLGQEQGVAEQPTGSNLAVGGILGDCRPASGAAACRRHAVGERGVSSELADVLGALRACRRQRR